MLRCLRLPRSVAMSSLRWMALPSRRLTTICTYGRMRELTSVDSSSTNPSRFNVSDSNMAGDVGDVPVEGDSFTTVVPVVGASTVVASTQFTQDASTECGQDGSKGVAGAKSLDPDRAAFRRAAMLSFFLFALPCVVWLCFLLRALAHCRRWYSRQPKGQRRSRRPAQRG